MKRFVLFFFLFFVLFNPAVWAQNRVVAGKLTGANKEPLPGVVIQIKGTTTGTTTDAQGNYKILAPLGATLVISFIGFTTREVKVTEQNSVAPGAEGALTKVTPARDSVEVRKKKKRPAIRKPAYFTSDGEATLTDNSPSYVRRSGAKEFSDNHYVSGVHKIKFLRRKRPGKLFKETGEYGVFVLEDTYQAPDQKLRVNYVTSFTLDKINRLPELQTSYAQGRPVAGSETWRGPETGELFSWGPALRNLEFTGTPYDYDSNGTLNPKGQGNGLPAYGYNPYTIFRNGRTSDHSLTLSGRKKGVELNVNYGHRMQRGVMPGSKTNRDNLSLKLKTQPFYKTSLEYLLAYADTRHQLPGRGAAQANVLASIYLMPPTFNNGNRTNRGKTLDSPAAYTLPSGGQRSFSPGLADNPYWLANTMPDAEQYTNLVSSIAFKYRPTEHFNINYVLGLDRQKNDSEMGLAQGAAGSALGRYTSRKVNRQNFNSALTGHYENTFDWLHLETSLTADFNRDHYELERVDVSGFQAENDWQITDGLNPNYFSADKIRNRQETAALVHLKYRDLANLRLTNRTYISSTLDQDKYFLPAVSAGFNFTQLEPLTYIDHVLSNGRLYSSFSRSVNEAPLVYTKWHYNSLLYRAAEYASYFEQSEIIHQPGLKPEQIRKFEAGVDLGFLYGKINLNFNYFNNLTQGVLVPVQNGQFFGLQNAADLKNKGYELEASYFKHGKLRLNPAVHFSLNRPTVTRLYNGLNRLPLAGFSNISTNLVVGEPYGVIYGTQFSRNENGQVIIGADGFPQVTSQPSRIGNPNPNWTAGLSNTIGGEKLALTFVFDFRKGGDVWNGTQSALNYFGKSKLTADQRDTRQYIFDGVKADNSPNSTLVDFANPANSLAQNRWVRYGFAGVGEEAIEQASWVRLSELKITYTFSRLSQRLIPASNASVSFIGKNLWLHSNYQGTDPASALFGYEEGRGLDLFNAPGTRTFGLALQVAF